MLKLQDHLRNRIQDGIRKYARIVTLGRERGMNERDTGDIVRAMLGDMLGYDPFFDVTTEASLRGTYADFAVQTEGRLRFLVCVKPLGILPHAAHLLRMSGANAPPYADWVLLTNADVWACYRLGVGMDRHPDLVFRVSVMDAQPLDEKATLFFLASREGAEQNALEQYWEQTRVLHPSRLAELLLSEESLQLLKREIQRHSSFRIDTRSLRERIAREVLRPDALVSPFHADPTGANLPQCYAYCGDTNDAETWRLRYRSADGTPNADLMTQAVAELARDPRSLGIPPDDLPLVKDRLRSAFLALGVSPEDLPALLRY